MSVLFFWGLFGIFANFSFPYRQVCELIWSCFNKSSITTKVNSLQKELQQADISQLNNQDPVQKLNNLESQAWLYIEILNKLGRTKPETQVRVAKTIEALKHQQLNIKNELKLLNPEKYRRLSKIQEFLQFITLTQAEKDLIKIENIINQLTSYTSSSQPSETIIQDVINRLSSEGLKNINRISPKRRGLVYKLEELLTLIRQNESELEKLNKERIIELESKRNIYSRGLKKLLEEKYIQEQKLEKYSQDLDNLNHLIAEYKSEIEKLKINNERYVVENYNLNNKNENLTQMLEEKQRRLRELESQEEAYNRQIHKLEEDIRQKDRELNQYSGQNPLKGDYIGNLSDKKSKYHFHQKCRDWKNLALEYIFMLDDSRQVISSSDETIFKENGLEECITCKNKRENELK